jgi:hypothetical protein
MKLYSEAAMERAMKIQEVILRAMAKKITWWQAAEIIGISDRQMRRWKERYEEYGYDGLYDRRRGQPSPRRVPLGTVEKVLQFREAYHDFNVRHFHEKLVDRGANGGSVRRGPASACGRHQRHRHSVPANSVGAETGVLMGCGCE